MKPDKKHTEGEIVRVNLIGDDYYDVDDDELVEDIYMGHFQGEHCGVYVELKKYTVFIPYHAVKSIVMSK